MNVAIYCRVSTDKQELDNQKHDLLAYSKKCNWELYSFYEDVISGKENSRPAFDALFVDARRHLFDVVLFWDISRFSRSGTLYTLQRLKELDNLGIVWHSYQEPYFSSAGQFKDVVISIMATLAKMERERISDRTKAGLRRAERLAGGKDKLKRRGKDKRRRKRRTPIYKPHYIKKQDVGAEE